MSILEYTVCVGVCRFGIKEKDRYPESLPKVTNSGLPIVSV
jgi:hypothetical protein